jgi:hypothetical protein
MGRAVLEWMVVEWAGTRWGRAAVGWTDLVRARTIPMVRVVNRRVVINLRRRLPRRAAEF